MNLFNSSNSWLSDLATDEAFVAALHREQQEVIDNPQGLIPTDPNNILSLKMRFSDMVRGCTLPNLVEGDTASCWVDEETLKKAACLMDYLVQGDYLTRILASLALKIFLYGFKDGKCHFLFDQVSFSEIIHESGERRERDRLLAEEEYIRSIPSVPDDVGKQGFCLWEVEQGIQSSPQCNRQSECHHPDQDEHGASAHTYNFMHRAFTDVYTIREYIEREYVVLRQIEYNQTNWITPRLRYAMLYLLEIRCIVNDTLEIKIPDSTNQTLFLELTSQGWFKNPRFRLGQQ